MSYRTDDKVGDTIVLDFTADPYTNLKPGDEGVVSFIDDAGTVSARWTNGSNLGLIPGVDRWHRKT